MQFAWLLLAACVVGTAYSVQHTDDCCSTEDKKEISWMWHKIWHSSFTDRKVRIMTAVAHDLVEHHPEAKPILEAKGLGDESSPKFRAQMVKLVHAFDNIINLLDDPLILEEQLHFMAEKFGARAGLHKTYFHALAESLERVLPQASSCFNTAAWTRCLDRLADIVSAKVQD